MTDRVEMSGNRLSPEEFRLEFFTRITSWMGTNKVEKMSFFVEGDKEKHTNQSDGLDMQLPIAMLDMSPKELLDELAEYGAAPIGVDILLGDQHDDHTDVPVFLSSGVGNVTVAKGMFHAAVYNNLAIAYGGPTDWEIRNRLFLCLSHAEGVLKGSECWSDVRHLFGERIRMLTMYPARVEFTSRGLHYRIGGLAPGAKFSIEDLTGRFPNGSLDSRFGLIERTMTPS